jgi:hypothetical protein
MSCAAGPLAAGEAEAGGGGAAGQRRQGEGQVHSTLLQ